LNKETPRTRLTEHDAQLNLRTMLELCAAGKLRCSEKTVRPSAATVRTITDNLANGDFYDHDPIMAFAWPLLLQAGGLAKLDGGKLQLTPKGRDAMRKAPAEVLRLLWQRWLSHAVIDEFSRVEEIKGQRISNVLTAAKPRRQTVGRALAECPQGEWLFAETLFSIMRTRGLNPTIARSDRALWKLYLVEAEYGSLGYDGYYQWDMLEGRYTLALLFEYAATLGMFDLEYTEAAWARDDFRENWGGDALEALSRYDGLQRIRLTALGGHILGLTEEYRPMPVEPDAGAVKVLPNLDIVATGALAPADELTLSAYAEQTSDRIWTVSARSLLTAVDSGRGLAEFSAFLNRLAEQELPAILTTLLDDVTRRISELTDLGHARVIECGDPAVAMLIARDRGLRGLCRLLGERHLAVPLDQETKFRKALLKLGYVLDMSADQAPGGAASRLSVPSP
jgi:hypothetical protein